MEESSAQVERDMAGETVCGFRVAAYRETHPEHGDKYGHRYSEHWSTPSQNPAVKVERLFTEAQLREALAAPAPAEARSESSAQPDWHPSDEQIAHMVQRFLGWKLPEDFRPDAGISFIPEHSVEFMASIGKAPMRHEPTGTNLFDARQAEAMVRHMLAEMPVETPEPEIGPPTPLGALRFRMEQGGHTQADLARLIGSRSHAAEILAGKRSISKAQICLLVDEWGIPARSLLGPSEGVDIVETPAEARSANGGWRPIETAPKDGTKFLAWPCFIQPRMAVAVETAWYRHPSVEGWTTDAIDCGDYEFEPTLWQPLPTPPKAEAECPDCPKYAGKCPTCHRPRPRPGEAAVGSASPEKSK